MKCTAGSLFADHLSRALEVRINTIQSIQRFVTFGFRFIVPFFIRTTSTTSLQRNDQRTNHTSEFHKHCTRLLTLGIIQKSTGIRHRGKDHTFTDSGLGDFEIVLKLTFATRRSLSDVERDVERRATKSGGETALHLVVGIAQVGHQPTTVICCLGINPEVFKTEKATNSLLCFHSHLVINY